MGAARPLRVLFAGSPAIAVPALEALAAGGAGFELAGLLTNPDSPRGRSGRPEPTECASALSRVSNGAIPTLKPERLDGDARGLAGALKPDLLVSFAYGKIFGPKFLGLFPLGGINAHPSLLPRHRGATPIPAAILGGDAETGLTVQRLAAEMDRGDVLTQERVPLNGRETTAGLSATMARMAAETLPPLIGRIAAGGVQGRAQDDGAATYCSLVSKADGLIDWGLGARQIDARIRAYTPWPLSWTAHGDLRLFILKARAAPFHGTGAPGEVLGKDENMGILIGTGEGALAVTELQYRGKKALGWKDFLNGARNFMGGKLG